MHMDGGPPPPPLTLVRNLNNNKWAQEGPLSRFPLCVGIVRDSHNPGMATVYCLVHWVVPGETVTEVTSYVDLAVFQGGTLTDFPSFSLVADAVQEDVLRAPFARQLKHLSPACLLRPCR